LDKTGTHLLSRIIGMSLALSFCKPLIIFSISEASQGTRNMLPGTRFGRYCLKLSLLAGDVPPASVEELSLELSLLAMEEKNRLKPFEILRLSTTRLLSMKKEAWYTLVFK